MAGGDYREFVSLCGDWRLLGVASHKRMSPSLFASAERRFGGTSGGTVRPTRICFHRTQDESLVGRRPTDTLDDRKMRSRVSLLSTRFHLRRVVADWLR